MNVIGSPPSNRGNKSRGTIIAKKNTNISHGTNQIQIFKEFSQQGQHQNNRISNQYANREQIQISDSFPVEFEDFHPRRPEEKENYDNLFGVENSNSAEEEEEMKDSHFLSLSPDPYNNYNSQTYIEPPHQNFSMGGNRINCDGNKKEYIYNITIYIYIYIYI